MRQGTVIPNLSVVVRIKNYNVCEIPRLSRDLQTVFCLTFFESPYPNLLIKKEKAEMHSK